jgi:heme/copper-type cytochrome/quinol oxidase subunit 3
MSRLRGILGRTKAPEEEPVDVWAEPPEVQDRNLWVGARVIGGTTIMLFLAFVFAYFYLRSLNNSGRWRPDGVDPPQGYGAAIVLLFAGSAVAFAYAAREGRNRRAWLPAAGLALGLGLVGCVVQCFEWGHAGFGPLDGGYASVFIGWTIFLVLFALMALYWVEILFAEGLRHRRESTVYVPAGLGDAAFYWGLVASIAVLTWAILYLL